jgi:hypothetical protein
MADRYVQLPYEMFALRLEVYEFRVYCHLANEERISRTTEHSIPKIAEHCRISEYSVRHSLFWLAKRAMIVTTKKPGLPSIHKINPPHLWKKREL